MELFDELVSSFPATAFSLYFEQINTIILDGLQDQEDPDVLFIHFYYNLD